MKKLRLWHIDEGFESSALKRRLLLEAFEYKNLIKSLEKGKDGQSKEKGSVQED